MNHPYHHLLSPIRIGNLVLKNRLTASSSVLHFLQGPEKFPTEAMITHISNKAKSGAALVTCRGVSPRVGPKRVANLGDIPHMFNFDLYDPQCQNYLSNMADAVHFYNSKLCMNLGCRIFEGYDVSAGLPARPGQTEPSKELTREMLEEIADNYAEQASILKNLGIDMVSLHMAYRHQSPGRMLSPLLNFRTDEFGGCLENRIRFPLMCCRRIKEACGTDFPIQVLVSAEEPLAVLDLYHSEGASYVKTPENAARGYGTTLDDTIAFARAAADEGLIDVLQLRAGCGDPAHPTGFTAVHEPFIQYAQALKDANIPNMLIETVGGYFDPVAANAVIKNGQADLIAMARTWISNSDYVQLLEEDRAEDITPCLRCNKCHGVSFTGPWYSQCAVNPVMGMENRIPNMIIAPTQRKKVAVVGGGPAGMKAAIILSDRGHDVTLYEACSALGGQIKHADHAVFKWPLRDFKDYLIHQVEKRPIRVLLNTKATPELLEARAYDHVIAALGAEPIRPRIPGADHSSIRFAEYVYGQHEQLGAQVVIVGGGEIGVETGIYLAQNGHKVLVLEMRDTLAADAQPLHYRDTFMAAWENEPNFEGKVSVRCTEIGADYVTYEDNQGSSHTVHADSVVLAVGTKARADEAMTFYGSGKQFSMIGDCGVGGSIHNAIRTAFAVASRI